MSLPADRGHLATEQRHQASRRLDALDSRQCVELMVRDHRTVCDAVAAASESIARFIDDLVPRVRSGGRLVYLGAGTSGRLGVLDAAECPPTFGSDPGQVLGLLAGGDAALRRSSEGLEDDPDGARAALAAIAFGARDTLLGIAAGGTTPYVLGGLGLAKAHGAMTALLTCARPAVRPPTCDHLVVLETGAELLAGSTRLKAGSATKLVLNIITTTLFVQLGTVYSNLMVDLRATNDKLRDRAIRILIELCPGISRAAAAQRLEEAGGHLKIAIVMERLTVDRKRAEALLEAHGGRLGSILA
jgi:N-acetylmuramic acid 6-phosphate etherase